MLKKFQVIFSNHTYHQELWVLLQDSFLSLLWLWHCSPNQKTLRVSMNLTEFRKPFLPAVIFVTLVFTSLYITYFTFSLIYILIITDIYTLTGRKDLAGCDSTGQKETFDRLCLVFNIFLIATLYFVILLTKFLEKQAWVKFIWYQNMKSSRSNIMSCGVPS